MKRKALIIVTPAGAGLQALRGAEQDAVDWQAFLQSPEGGAWRTAEIEILRDPTKLTVEARLRAERGNNYDFVLLGFSGHGEIVQYVSGARENRMYLRHPSDFLTEKTFTISGQRELLCADACREVSPILFT